MTPTDEILTFWFGAPESPEYGTYRVLWFQSSPQLDAEIREKFGDMYEQAVKGELQAFSQTPQGTLALIILLDQFSRNMYRGTVRAFASDAQALALAKHAVEKGFDRQLLPVQRMFCYLPFEHSENLEDQDKSIELFQSLGNEEVLVYAQQHRDLIAQFGRFPHRNGILGRKNTPAEEAFLANPDAPNFGQVTPA